MPLPFLPPILVSYTGNFRVTKKNPSIRGNALFLILIAVALFGALSYAVTQSGRGSGTVDRETALIGGSEIARFFGSIEQAITRLKIINGCADNQLNFENTVYCGGVQGPWFGACPMIPPGTNTNSPSDGSCSVFHPAGGGITPVILKSALGPMPPADTSSVWWGWSQPGHPFFTSQVVPGVGTAEPDIVASMMYVPEQVCRQFGKGMGREPPILHSEMGDWTDHQFTDGTYPNSFGGGWGAGMPSGIKAWCMDGEDAFGSWHIFYVVYAR